MDGTEPFHRIQWHVPERTEGLELYVQSDSYGALKEYFDDQSTVFIKFKTLRRIGDEVRIEIRRGSGKRFLSELNYTGPLQRPFQFPGSKSYYVATEGRWGELNAWMKGQGSLTIALVRRDGTVLAEDRLDETTLNGAVAAVASIRAKMGEIALDYRRNCEIPRPIIVGHPRIKS